MIVVMDVGMKGILMETSIMDSSRMEKLMAMDTTPGQLQERSMMANGHKESDTAKVFGRERCPKIVKMVFTTLMQDLGEMAKLTDMEYTLGATEIASKDIGKHA